jgi:hypothetical protein
VPRKVAEQQLQLETPFLEPSQPRADDRSLDTRRATSVRRNDVKRREELRYAEHRPSPAELLETPGALLTRSHLRGLGLERRAIDAVFRALPVVALPGYSRPMIRAEQYLELVEQYTYRDDRVRPCHA